MDPIANMVSMIKNAQAVGRSSILVPFSKMKLAILENLVKLGFIQSVTKKTKTKFPYLEINLIYTDKRPKINEIKMISKPSRRVYVGFREIYPIKNGRGEVILSTPKGILTGRQARKEKVGGEVLFEIW